MIAAGDMTGKTAIITGAAAGLGRATALKLAAAGGNLCLVDINAAGLQNTAAEAAALDVETLILTEDLARPDAGRDIVAACVERFGRIDALCNVAAVFLPRHTTKMSDEDWGLVSPSRSMMGSIAF
jgi:NAD(P)-dependent dehydrogenase (short-subunit alcohol dehydrogenase family)